MAASDEEARALLYSAELGYRHFYGHMQKVYSQLGRLAVFKTRPDMRDDEVTVDTFIEQRTIFGSPKTVQSQADHAAGDRGPVRDAAADHRGLGGTERGVGARIAGPASPRR